MLRENRTAILRTQRTIDVLLTACAFAVAFILRKDFAPGSLPELGFGANYGFLFLLCLVVFSMSYQYFGLYEPMRAKRLGEILLSVVKAVAAGFAAVTLFLYFMKSVHVSRVMMGTFLFLDVLFLALLRAATYGVLSYIRVRGRNFRTVLVVGSREQAADIDHVVAGTPSAGYRLFGCLLAGDDGEGDGGGRIPVVGRIADFREVLLNNTIDEVIFASPLGEFDDARQCVSFAEEIGIGVHILLDWEIQKMMYRPETAGVFFDHFLGFPTIAVTTTPQKSGELMVKTALDYLGAAAGLVILSPLFALTALLIRLDTPGPVFYRQERSGVNGRRFTLYKFRTMVNDADSMIRDLEKQNEMDGPVFKVTKDPRITGVGRVLRKWSIDELPQLINVLKGEMSLVGPRPPLPAEVEQYEPWQRRRLSMKPGMTCIWQVNGRNAVDFERWMKMDLEYIDTWSLLLDFKLLAMTVRAVVSGTGK